MKEQGRRQPLWHRVEWLPGEPVFGRKLESWKAGSENDVAANQSWTRPVRFSLGDRGETIISSATGEEILRLSHEEFCDMLRDLKTPVSRAVSRRVKLPLIECRHPATPAMELTANKVAQVLLKQKVASADEAARR